MPVSRTIVVTGANRGIGFSAVRVLLEEDEALHVVMIGRSAPENGRLTTRVTFVSADLESIASVSSAADQVRLLVQSHEIPPLAGFVGNAGVLHTDALHTSADGFESTFAVNVIANHILIEALTPSFTPDARIVITVSDAHFGDFAHNMGLVAGPAWSEPERLALPGAFAKPETTTAGGAAYATSKLAAIYLVHEWARRLGDDATVVSFNPAFVPGTGLSRESNALIRFLMKRVIPLLAKTPMASTIDAAGRNLADVVLGRVSAPTGSYVDRRQVTPSSDESYDPSRESELRVFLEEIRTAA